MASTLLQAALSFYIAERDKCLAELGICLNSPSGSSDGNTTDKVVNLFRELTIADYTIVTINEIIEGNKKNDIGELAKKIEQVNSMMENIPRPAEGGANTK